MDKSKVAQLYDLSVSAYQAEELKQYGTALQKHREAISQWRAFEKTGTFFSTEEREYKRVSKKKIELHEERVAMLVPIQVWGTGQANFKTLPTLQSLAAGFPNPNSAVVDTVGTPTIHLTAEERASPQVIKAGTPSFIKSLPSNLPDEKYKIRQSSNWKQAFTRWYLYTIQDAATEKSLYILEACHRHNMQLTVVTFYRVSEYPNPAIKITLGQVRPTRSRYETGSGFKGRQMILHSAVLTKPIPEIPDRLERKPWGPRRFVYGGRRFVWKAFSKGRDLEPETLYEYTTTKPTPGSKTGKKDDDASEKRIFWGTSESLLQRGWIVNCVGGLDQAFKEHLLASQAAKLVAMMTALS